MTRIQLSIAVGDYDHIRDLLSGAVPVEGVDLVVARSHPVEEIFHRFIHFREWDISEMSFAKYVALRSQPDCDLEAIPVFPSRAFRHSSFYVPAGSNIDSPAQLAGKRVGIPEWAQTAAIYTRGMIAHDYGVPLRDITWHQAGVNQPGRKEKVRLQLPEGVRYVPVPDQSLSQMLEAGTIDAALSARAPDAFLSGRGQVRRLFASARDAELAYWRKTGIFPIMHVVAIRRAVLQAHPWIAMNLLQAFEEAKRRSLERMSDVTASFAPLPWLPMYAELSRELLGPDFWPYGVEPNRRTLEAFLLYAWEQGICQRQLSPEELFAPSCLATVRV